MLIQFEPANAQDKNFFWNLHVLSFKEVFLSQFGGWDPADQYRYFEQKWASGDFSKILADRRIVGGIALRDYPDHLELTEIQIHPMFQNQGLGSCIIGNLIDKAGAAGKPLRLHVFLHSQAFRLYQRLGFKIISQDHYQYHMEYAPPARS